MKIHNFSAGPAILPNSVLKKSADAIQNFKNMNLSILEISHRSPQFVEVMSKARFLVNELLGLDNKFEILFLTGGASSQFFMTAMNFLTKNDIAYYINTGTWSNKAIKEAHKFGDIVELASSKENNFNYIPKSYTVPNNGRYLHLTSNNTIFGTQIHEWPKSEIPVICDMSSDIFSREIDSNYFDIIYAGAQKNMGPAGTTLVIIKKSFLKSSNSGLPSMLDYKIHASKDSSFNTPPVYPIYVSMLTMNWIKENGGVKAMEKINLEKAHLLYKEIDRNSKFYGTATKEDRSLMNVAFLLHDDTKNSTFLEMAALAGISGIKGHRSVGGFRASIYNAMPIESIKVLIGVMVEFERL